jgi:hypothetical protein
LFLVHGHRANAAVLMKRIANFKLYQYPTTPRIS